MMRKSFNMRMDASMIAALDRIAAEAGTSRLEVVRVFCKEGIKAHQAFCDEALRDREAREYFAKFLVEKGIAKPNQVANDSFFYGAAPSLWLKKVEKKLGAEVANEVSAKIVEIMGRTDELEAYLADDSE